MDRKHHSYRVSAIIWIIWTCNLFSIEILYCKYLYKFKFVVYYVTWYLINKTVLFLLTKTDSYKTKVWYSQIYHLTIFIYLLYTPLFARLAIVGICSVCRYYLGKFYKYLESAKWLKLDLGERWWNFIDIKWKISFEILRYPFYRKLTTNKCLIKCTFDTYFRSG